MHPSDTSFYRFPFFSFFLFGVVAITDDAGGFTLLVLLQFINV